jgi:adenylate cyclase
MQMRGTEQKGHLMGSSEATLLQVYAGRERQTSVLVAAMSEREGQRPAVTEPATARAIARCLETLGRAAEASGGRVIRRHGNEVMALFATPDAAAAAAARMQYEASRILPAHELGVRTAFHSGPVRQRGHDIAGDTVNLAAELASRAAHGQILTSGETAASLGAAFRHAVRPLPLAAKSAGTAVGELDWRGFAPVPGLEDRAKDRTPELHLTYRYNTLLRRREGDCITAGRDPDCDLCVDMRLASRRHCTLERRNDKFVLRDHSTNGTFVTMNGDRELRIRAEEIVLYGRGWLSFGAPRLLADELVQFRCE